MGDYINDYFNISTRIRIFLYSIKSNILNTLFLNRGKNVKTSKNVISNRFNFCNAKKKGVRLIVTLECTEAKSEGGVPSHYTTQKKQKEYTRQIRADEI